jgi:hypothetical protein
MHGSWWPWMGAPRKQAPYAFIFRLRGPWHISLSTSRAPAHYRFDFGCSDAYIFLTCVKNIIKTDALKALPCNVLVNFLFNLGLYFD